ncbi:MAG: 4-hydroxythreonine-4-phosphate dehydrogenase PdxA [Ignavibacteriae bacterium]|nr:4-hydroxythreonine-4-phosphate dehydrogenase PdxA [Ignavibacteriota bacterium]
MKNTFAFTCGDVNGIGPEIVIKTINKIFSQQKHKIIFICPYNVFENSLKIVPSTFPYKKVNSLPDDFSSNEVLILNVGNLKQSYGNVRASAGKTAYNSILKACSLASDKVVDCIITAPISKETFKKAKINFPGHTELLADFFSVKDFAMMFVSNKMKAALTTIHIPIKDVSKKINLSQLRKITNVILKSLKEDFKIMNPNIAMLGLNPHAGENGNIGAEEINVISQFIKSNKKHLHGPFVPDAFFGNRLYKNYDCTIGMYHDQILIPFKLLNFNKGVNFTAGLPIVRTSPDHGTAFDIAGKGIAKADSMIEAYNFANKIITSRKKIK